MYSDEMKLRILCRKVDADFLQSTRQIINIDLTRTPVTMTYTQALASFRNEVNRKFPPDLTTTARARRMAELDAQYNSGRGRGRGRGRGKNPGRGRGRGIRGVRSITGIDGKEIEVHPAYKFSDNDWYNIPLAERSRLIQERQDFNANKRQRIGEVHTDYQDDTQESQIPAGGGHIMGGRNEQASLRNAKKIKPDS